MKNNVVSLVGKVNVGKSTLFNSLLRKKKAITNPRPGITRDCKFEIWEYMKDEWITLVDTPGYFKRKTKLAKEDQLEGTDTLSQIEAIIEESDIILFVIDTELGLVEEDKTLLKLCYQANKTIIAIYNKIDSVNNNTINDIDRIDTEHKLAISGQHKHGLLQLKEKIQSLLPTAKEEEDIKNTILDTYNIALIGKPNVGKSSLINYIIGKNISIISSKAGTTRDTIATTLTYKDNTLSLTDTAGIRKKTKIHDVVEKEAIAQVLYAIRTDQDLILYIIDAEEGITHQDHRLINLILDNRKQILILINKYDLIDRYIKEKWHEETTYSLKNYPYLDYICTSAINKIGKYKVLEKVITLKNIEYHHKTSYLTKILLQATENHEPPLIGIRRIKLKVAIQSEKDPHTIVIHGNQTDKLPVSYIKYLSNYFQKSLGVSAIDTRIRFIDSSNPYKNK